VTWAVLGATAYLHWRSAVPMAATAQAAATAGAAAAAQAAAAAPSPIVAPNSAEWEWAQVIWDYHHMHHSLEKSDGILVLCSHDLRVADEAVRLYNSGLGEWIVFSGGFGTGPHSGANLNGWTRPEAEIFGEAAIDAGVPVEKVFVEPQATNTGENIANSRALLAARGITPRSLIVVQKPFMERRSFATFMKQWPEEGRPTIAISSPAISFADYPNADISREVVTSIMVGDLQRIKLYATPERPFQIPQEIPPHVWEAYENLVKAGFTMNVIPGS
jgi:uncharacterized SAM-binding protein YcdF (DUF218 family)